MIDTELTVRKASMPDIHALLELINGYAAKGIMLPRTEFEMSENIRDFTLVFSEGRLVGCGALHFYSPTSGEIRSLAVDPEAPCRVADGETGEPVDLPFGHTAWWSFEGTGGQVTVDTVGSDFDTALGVYSASLDPLGCVDDVDSLQARITVDTVVGVTYLVQAGGFAADSGVLELRLD